MEIQLPAFENTIGKTEKIVKVPLSQLPENSLLFSPDPSSNLVNDIAYKGQLVPVILTSPKNGVYGVVAGRRRIKAIRKLNETNSEKWNTVNAVILDLSQMEIYGVAASENNNRSENPITDLQAIMEIQAAYPGIEEKALSSITGIPISKLRKRLRLLSLDPELQKAFFEGKISLGAAYTASNLSIEKQNKLISSLEQTGKVTQEDVIETQRVSVQEKFDSLPEFNDLESLVEPDSIGYVLINEHNDLTSGILSLEEAQNSMKENLHIAKLVLLE